MVKITSAILWFVGSGPKALIITFALVDNNFRITYPNLNRIVKAALGTVSMHYLVCTVIRRSLNQPAVHLSCLSGTMDCTADTRIHGTPFLFRKTAGADEHNFAGCGVAAHGASIARTETHCIE
jgi:hypothetical protein